jgi:hypothetical protein
MKRMVDSPLVWFRAVIAASLSRRAGPHRIDTPETGRPAGGRRICSAGGTMKFGFAEFLELAA